MRLLDENGFVITAAWPLSHPDERKAYLQHLANKRLLASKPQIPCDVGLFGDEHLQLDLVEMLQDPDPQ